MKVYNYKEGLELEAGGQLPALDIVYSTWGRLNEARDNVIWICHALTANSNAKDWWPGMIGEGLVFDTDKYFIVCANIIGSCYGSTGPLSINPETGQPYYNSFPLVTIRDMVKAHEILASHLGINKIDLLAGGSMGGYQVLEWAVMNPSLINKLFVITTSASETPWGIAIHSSQRLAIEADSSWGEPSEKAGAKGLKAARAFGMITYRSYQTYHQTQSEELNSKLDHFRASSYINHQGDKLVNRFNAYSYWHLTKSMDSHNISRNRAKTIEEVLKTIQQKTLIIGIETDLLCPPVEQKLMSDYIPNATFVQINSLYGHDGFLVETEQISKHINSWINN
jgi:homoserine O-acetyltransferase